MAKPGNVASKILAAVAHEWAGTTKGMKDDFPWLVVILLINEMIRLGILAAAQATALTFTLYLRPSEAFRLCQDQVVPPVRVAGDPRV